MPGPRHRDTLVPDGAGSAELGVGIAPTNTYLGSQCSNAAMAPCSAVALLSRGTWKWSRGASLDWRVSAPQQFGYMTTFERGTYITYYSRLIG